MLAFCIVPLVPVTFLNVEHWLEYIQLMFPHLLFMSFVAVWLSLHVRLKQSSELPVGVNGRLSVCN